MNPFKSLAAIFLGGAMAAHSMSVVEYHGALGTKGADVVNSRGEQVQLTGMSFFWDVWMDKYYNKQVVNWLVDDWQCSILRAAMGVEPAGAYLADPASAIERTKVIVDAAIAKGVYVVIDWHSHAMYTAEAKVFFAQMAQMYGDQPNVIFEIWNEPHKASPDYTWAQIKAYALEVIPEIRKYTNNLIVVGTPQYSLNVSAAASDPIVDIPNIAYTLHFYAGTHMNVASATFAANKIPIMVTEWGTTISDGGNKDKTAYTEQSQTWYDDLIDPRKISSLNWSVSDKAEGASILVPGASISGGWNPETDLTPSGIWIRNLIRKHCADDPTVCPKIGTDTASSVPTFTLPGTITLADYADFSGILKQTTTEPAGGKELTSIGAGDWTSYTVSVPTAATLGIRVRVASNTSTGIISLRLNDQEIDSIRVPSSGGTQKWIWAYGTRRASYAANATHNLRFQYTGSGLSMFNAQRAEIFPTAIETASVPGALNPIGYALRAMNMGVAEIGENSSLALFGLKNGSNVSYRVKAPAAGKYAFTARTSVPGTGGQLQLKVNSALKATIELPSTGSDQTWQSIQGEVDLPAGVSTLGLFAVGDTSVKFNIAGMYIFDATSVLPRSGIPGMYIVRGASSLELAGLPTAGFREALVVSAEGRILSRTDISGLSNAKLPLPSSRLPAWIRLNGTTSATLAVPPTR